MENSRTRNVLKNVSWTTLLQIILMLLQFVVRTVFIRRLGRDYLGITGLFTDIMWILDLANLRIPEAIILSMYKPLAEDNKPKVLALMYLLRKTFLIISVTILTLGLMTLPLLKFIIKDPPNIPENFSVLFLFYLFEIVAIYAIIYKRNIIYADQKNYILSIYRNVAHFIQIIIQIIVLLKVRNFYVFVSIQVIVTLIMNFMLSAKADRMYPFIKEKSTYKLNTEEISEIKVNIKSMFIYGLGSVSLIGVDSILVSSIVGIGILGLCSNYMLVINSVKALIDQSMIGFTASIGNLNVKKDPEASETTFNQVNFIVFMVTSFFAVNLAASLNTLISIWLGESYMIAQAVVISLVLRFYIQSTQYATFTFRSTLGLLKKKRFIPLYTAAVNIVSSIIMGRFFGVAGIFFASSIAIFFFTILPEALLLYKDIFGKSSITFFIRYFGYIIFMAGNYFITGKIIDQLPYTGWTNFFLRAILGALISFSIFILVFFRDKNFRALCSRLLYIIKDRNKN